MKNSKKIYYYLLFLLWPFAALVPALLKFKEPIGRTIIVLIFSYFGFTTTSEGDLKRYEEKFYANQRATMDEIISAYTSFQKVDLYYDVMTLFSDLFFETHHGYFAIMFGLFGFFYTQVLALFLKINTSKFSKGALLVFLGFALFYSIRNTISMRFYSGGLYFIYMFLSYIYYNKSKYLWLTLLTPLFHFGLALVVLIPPLFLLLRDKWILVMSIVAITFVLGQSTVVTFIGRFANTGEETALSSRYNSYAADDGRERFEEIYAQRFIDYNWKAKTLEVWWRYMFYICTFLTFVLFFFKDKLINQDMVKNIFLLSLLLLAAANIMINISNGDRYVSIFIFVFLGLSFLIYIKRLYRGTIHRLMFMINFLGLLYGFAAIYAANPLFTYKFFFFNYISSAISIYPY